MGARGISKLTKDAKKKPYKKGLPSKHEDTKTQARPNK
jgi:hypothetical protein